MEAYKLVATTAFLLWCIAAEICAQVPCQELGYPHTNQSFEFSMVSTRNQTGHWITQFLLNKATPKIENHWKVDLKHSVAEYAGIYSLKIHGIIAVAPPKPTDYEFVPGIGFYKLHRGDKKTFSEASAACAREGGHLAIINSDEEASAIKEIYSRSLQETTTTAYVGFFDQSKKRNFVTIYGE
ncbi:hypothetical protein J437_LFUL002021 [Ladona fulva]|uniref:C-type lectin domain-containing protein n=1 Tax=Ladona fulva TaxID=123851 RepID=A0A8K0JVA4_LADFU|nr:hypothetical protein J437_LFUL002021 [Ladona fulva]